MRRLVIDDVWLALQPAVEIVIGLVLNLVRLSDKSVKSINRLVLCIRFWRNISLLQRPKIGVFAVEVVKKVSTRSLVRGLIHVGLRPTEILKILASTCFRS